MQKQKTIGILLLTGTLGVLIPYIILTIIFNYPAVLREDTGTILTAFHDGGKTLIATWFAFGLTGAALIPAYIFIGHTLEKNDPMVRLATTVGVAGLIIQMIGLLRWVFVVPVLSDEYVHATHESTRVAIMIAFRTIHQFAGVLLGEHLGQLFTIAWTVIISFSLFRQRVIPIWLATSGVFASVIYLCAQAELFATVIPGFPMWQWAGFIGSTLWLMWLIILAILFINNSKEGLLKQH